MILSLKSLYVTARPGRPKSFMWSMSREKSAPLLPINLVHLHLSAADWLQGGRNALHRLRDFLAQNKPASWSQCFLNVFVLATRSEHCPHNSRQLLKFEF